MPFYPTTNGGRMFPLRFIDSATPATDISLSEAVTASPTFVLVDNGKEIARFVGYPGREHFLRLMNGAADALQEERGAK
jgi:thioredoxin-related protein